MNRVLLTPEVQEKRKKLATQVYTITRKAVDWGEENGYSALIRDIDKYMKAYRNAMKQIELEKAERNTNWYERQSPEKLEAMLKKEKERINKLENALLGKI